MAEIGLAASAAGLVGLAGQITQGCLYLKTLLEQVKHGPAELGTLWRELELASATIEDFHRLWNRLKDSRNTTVDPSASLRNCNEALSSLTNYIKPFLLVLSNPDSRITGTQYNWKRLKSALQRSTMRNKLENLSRARQSLVEVQLNMTLALLDDQTRSTRQLSSSLSQIKNSSCASDEILKQVHQISERGASEVSEVHVCLDSLKADLSVSNENLSRVIDGTEGIASKTLEIREGILIMQATSTASTEQLSQVAKNTSEAVEGIRKSEAAIDQLFGRMSAVATTEVDNFTTLQECLLGQIRREFAKQAQSQELILSGLSHVVDRSVQGALEGHLKKNFGHIAKEKESVSSRKGPLLEPVGFKSVEHELEKAPSTYCIPGIIKAENESGKYVVVSKTEFLTPLFLIIVRTIRGRIISGHENATSTRTAVEIQLRIDLLQKCIVLTSYWTKYNFGFDMSLRTRNIISNNSQILRAVKDLDIEVVRELFETGFASPFDIDFGGNSLLSICFKSVQNFALLSNCDNQRFEAFRKMISFSIDNGSEWTGCILYLIPDLSKVAEQRIQDLLADVVRKIIMHAKFSPMDMDASFDRPGIYLDLTASRGPLGQMLLQQDYWMVDWSAQPAVGPDQMIFFWENDREILADINGSRLLELLNQNTPSKYAIIPAGATGHSYKYDAIFSDLLKLSAGEASELRAGCLNRMIILLKHGWNPRQLVSIKEIDGRYAPQYSVSEYALQTKTLHLWKEALEVAGRSRMEILHLLDEDTYHGLPELVDGEVAYLTHNECWEDFITGLLCGRYINADYFETMSLTKSLSCNLKADIFLLHDAINASNVAFSLKKMPGSWAGTEETLLKPGDNDEFDLQITKLLYEYKEDWLEKYGYGEFTDQPEFLEWGHSHNAPFVLERLLALRERKSDVMGVNSSVQ